MLGHGTGAAHIHQRPHIDYFLLDLHIHHAAGIDSRQDLQKHARILVADSTGGGHVIHGTRPGRRRLLGTHSNRCLLVVYHHHLRRGQHFDLGIAGQRIEQRLHDPSAVGDRVGELAGWNTCKRVFQREIRGEAQRSVPRVILADIVIEKPLQSVLQLTGQGHLSDGRFNQHLPGGNVHFFQGAEDPFVILAGRPDQQ